MDDREAQEERAELISRLFALITAKLEDTATIAAESQGKRPIEELRENAGRLQAALQETVTVVDGVAAVLG